MWNAEFNILDEFLYIKARDLGYLGPIFRTFFGAQNILKQAGINQSWNSLYIWIRFHLMWNLKFNFLDDFLYFGVHD